ncbi:BRCT domain [Trinorchestia longiramus]|nr:BRCT domain [Trinorchestia longiramus]
MLLACVRGVHVVTDTWVYSSMQEGQWRDYALHAVVDDQWPVIKGVRRDLLQGKGVSLLQAVGVVYCHPHTAPSPTDLQGDDEDSKFCVISGTSVDSVYDPNYKIDDDKTEESSDIKENTDDTLASDEDAGKEEDDQQGDEDAG